MIGQLKLEASFRGIITTHEPWMIPSGAGIYVFNFQQKTNKSGFLSLQDAIANPVRLIVVENRTSHITRYEHQVPSVENNIAK